jgi:hypothetical protein
MKHKSLRSLMKKVRIVVDPNMVTHENDPFFLKKAEQGRKTIERCGIPPKLLEMQDKARNKMKEDKLNTKWHDKLKAHVKKINSDRGHDVL